jgi:tripartite-type tricarboxylate transporter receptor subunit TctC
MLGAARHPGHDHGRRAVAAEAGLGNVKVASWFALAAPAGTPANIVHKLHDEVVKAAQDPELQRRMAENGTPIHTTTPQQMGKLLAEEVASTKQLVETLGLRLQ